nr:hypothetical protein [Tanacetum cinerariifolium]
EEEDIPQVPKDVPSLAKSPELVKTPRNSGLISPPPMSVAPSVLLRPHSPSKGLKRLSAARVNAARLSAASAASINAAHDRNISYLSDFEELNGGYVAFGGNPKVVRSREKVKLRLGS